MTRVVFVCTANICRSAFMQTYARAGLASDEVTFESAGTHGFVDHPMSEEMAAEAQLWGLDPSEFRSRPLTAAILDEADLVLTAEGHHRQFILDDHPQAFRTVLTLGQASRAAATWEGSGATELIAALPGLRGRAEPVDDVADPYRRGAAAQEAAARQMGAMLDPLLAALGPIDRSPSRRPTHG